MACQKTADDGFALVEMMASIVLFGLVAGAILAMLLTSLGLGRTNRQRVVAADLAAQDLETTRNALKAGVVLPIGLTTSTQTVGETTYTLTRTTSWTSLGQSGDSCAGGLAGNVAYQRVKVAVTWQRMNGIPPVTSNTLVTPPGGQLNPNTIAIPVKIVNRNGTGLPNQTVTLTPVAGGAAQSQVTDEFGCALFAQLPPASYNISLNTSGYVDWQGSQSHTESAGSTTPGTTPIVTISYDEPGSLLLDPKGPGGYPLPFTPLRYTVFHTKWNSPGLRTVNGVSGSSKATLTPLFPFASDVYTGWAGVCFPSAKPSGFTSDTALVQAGSTSKIDVDVAPVHARFQDAGTSAPVSNAVVIATDKSCNDSYVLQGTTDANGELKFSLPFGSWQFKLLTFSRTYNSANAAVTLTDTNPTTAFPLPVS